MVIVRLLLLEPRYESRCALGKPSEARESMQVLHKRTSESVRERERTGKEARGIGRRG